jgi:hypothetical protein
MVTMRLEVQQDSIRAAVAKFLVVNEEEIAAMVKARLDAIDVGAELENAVRHEVESQLQSQLRFAARRIAAREAERLMRKIEEAT